MLVLERYLIPGGSGGSFKRAGYTFDVGASMIFGFGENGHTNLLTRLSRCEHCDTIPDPAQLEYHLPGGLNVAVDRDYESFVERLSALFPHEAKGIRVSMTPAGRCSAASMRCRCSSLRIRPTPPGVFQGSTGLPRTCPLAAVQCWRCGPPAHQRPQLLQFADGGRWSMPADLTPMIMPAGVFRSPCRRH